MSAKSNGVNFYEFFTRRLRETLTCGTISLMWFRFKKYNRTVLVRKKKFQKNIFLFLSNTLLNLDIHHIYTSFPFKISLSLFTILLLIPVCLCALPFLNHFLSMTTLKMSAHGYCKFFFFFLNQLYYSKMAFRK